MLFYSTFALTLSALSFFSNPYVANAGHASLHRRFWLTNHVQPRTLQTGNTQRDAESTRTSSSSDSGTIPISVNELGLLRIQSVAFHGWMKAWLDNENASDCTTAVALLRQEVEAYEGWMGAWVDAVSSGNTSSTLPAPPTKGFKSPVGITNGSPTLLFPQTFSAPPIQNTSNPITSPSAVANAAVQLEAQNPSSTSSSVISATEVSNIPKKGPTVIQQPPQYTSSHSLLSSMASNTYISSAVTTTVISTPATAASITNVADGNITSSSYNFDAQSSKNVAVYFGQSQATAETSLTRICSDPNVDIVVLAFLTKFFDGGGYPKVDFGSTCGSAQTPQMQAVGAMGLLNCPDLSSQIHTCQNSGKKVLLSLGGYLAITALSTDAQADQLAIRLWNLFGGGSGEDAGLRPFGAVRLDGFDVDNEDHSTAHYGTLVSSLRSAMNTDSSKSYYISAAPQCPRPDVSIPLDAMRTMDFVFVQFYNNKQSDCNVGQAGFLESFKAWSADLSVNGKGPKLYIGAPAASDAASNGYVPAEQLKSVIQSAKDAGVGNFGGVMLWDGAFGQFNPQGNYMAGSKAALG